MSDVDDAAVQLVTLYQTALAGLAMARGMVAAYETRVQRAHDELLRMGLSPDEELPELGVKLVPVPVQPLQLLGKHSHHGSVKRLPGGVLPKHLN